MARTHYSKRPMQQRKNKHNTYLLLVGIVLVGLVLRLYKFNSPVLDWHSFRQADTASVAVRYAQDGIDVLRPKYHDFSNIQSGQLNPHGYRMVEFPLLAAEAAALHRLLPTLSSISWFRLQLIFFSLTTPLSVYVLVRRWTHDTHTALIAAAICAVLPYNVFYSRALLPEPAVVAFSTMSIALFQSWLDTKKVWLGVVSALHLATALLLKPFVVFLAPVYISITLATYGKNTWKQWQLVVYAIGSIIPLFAWRRWIQHFPEGIPASDWLLNGNGIRLRPAWFRWLGYERLTKLILGFVGIVFMPLFVLVGGVARTHILSWWIGILLYFVVFATGNVQHDYYQVLLVPIVAITAAVGIVTLYQMLAKLIHAHIAQAVCVILCAAALFFSAQQVLQYYNINHREYILAGDRAQELIPSDGIVIAPAFGDTAFLFQTRRNGWPIGFEIAEKIADGAEYYISTSYDDEARELEQTYRVLEKTPDYIIIDLQTKKQ